MILDIKRHEFPDGKGGWQSFVEDKDIHSFLCALLWEIEDCKETEKKNGGTAKCEICIGKQCVVSDMCHTFGIDASTLTPKCP